MELAHLVHAGSRGPQGNARPGVTVADLEKKGAVALNDDQLKALVEEKSVWLQNTVTGDKYMIVYGALGKGPDAKPLTPVRARVRDPALPRQPGPVPGALRGKKRSAAKPDRRHGRREPLSEPRGPTASPTGGSSPTSSVRRSRSASTRLATNIWPRVATNSDTPTTRSFRRWRSWPRSGDRAPR